jgi:hypothetical protein
MFVDFGDSSRAIADVRELVPPVNLASKAVWLRSFESESRRSWKNFHPLGWVSRESHGNRILPVVEEESTSVIELSQDQNLA